MSRKYLWIAVVCVVVFTAVIIFTPPAQRPWSGSMLAVCLLFAAVIMAPAARKNKRASVVLGAGLIVAAFCLLVGGLAAAPAFTPEFVAGGFAALFLVGAMLIQLPRMAANMDSAVEAQAAFRRTPPPASGFQVVQELRLTLAAVLENRPAFARTVGPCFLAFCLFASPIFAPPDVWGRLLKDHKDYVAPVLLAFTAAVLIECCLVMLAAIRWTQFIATGALPSWSRFPGRALWGWFWRWLVFGGILRVTDKLEPWLIAHVPGMAPWQRDALGYIASFLILVLASPFALLLCAVALGSAATSLQILAMARRMAGRKFYLGSAGILAPFFLVSWVVHRATGVHPPPGVLAVAVVADILLVFAGVILGMTYLTRIYVRAADATPADGSKLSSVVSG